jgi:polyhydroxyalkanoate synthesis regulator protein
MLTRLPCMGERTSVLVKRYCGHRLYESAQARYVTAVQVQAWLQSGLSVVVRDALTGDDVTHAVLTTPSETN